MISEQAIGVDIGGTKIAFALIDSGGHVLATHRILIQADRRPATVIDSIITGISMLKAESDAPVGVGCCGYIDGGSVRYASNLGWRDVPLQDELCRRLGRRVTVENDARMALIGEYRFGAAQGLSDAAYLNIGTGLGAAALVGGCLLHGAAGVSMELGQMLRCDGTLLEAGTSGTGLLDMARAQGGDYTTTHDILTAFASGEEIAVHVLDDWLANIAEAAVWVCTLLNPDALIIGGGMGLAAYSLIESVTHAAISRRCNFIVAETVRILPAQVVSSAVGAAALVHSSEK